MLATDPMFRFEPIGMVHSPLRDKAEAPRQPRAAEGIEGSIELQQGKGYEFALEDLAGWERLWIVFVFDRAEGFRPKVQPPRSQVKRGLFSTRSPHRPNAIGISAVRLLRVEGLFVHISDLDLLDGTPVLDIKPYVPYADAFPHARTGWLEQVNIEGAVPVDPGPRYQVSFSELAALQLAWMRARGVDLQARLQTALELGPTPHPYRRIRKTANGYTLALKEWRIDFVVLGTDVQVLALRSGYKPKELWQNLELALHRDFASEFPYAT